MLATAAKSKCYYDYDRRQGSCLMFHVLDEKDLEEFRKAARIWGKKVTKSKKIATETLQKLGIRPTRKQ